MTNRDDVKTVLDIIEEWEGDHDTYIENVLSFDLAERIAKLLEQARAEGANRMYRNVELFLRVYEPHGQHLSKSISQVIKAHMLKAANAIHNTGGADG